MKTRPYPSAGEIHMYCLTQPGHPELARLESFLDAGETARVVRLKSAAARRRYIAGRGALRVILGEYLGIAPGDVRLATGEHGKPYLEGTGQGLRFNLAHAGDRFLLAVATDREIGVDIERSDPSRPLAKMAELVFSHGEREWLSRCAAPQQATAFHRLWVRKEACLKACGRGFSLAGSSFDLVPPEERTAGQLIYCDQVWWQVLDIEVPAGFCAALAIAVSGQSPTAPNIVWLEFDRGTLENNHAEKV